MLLHLNIPKLYAVIEFHFPVADLEKNLLSYIEGMEKIEE